MITVVTPTVGRSAHRLDILLREMRAFTRLPFKQIVSDDGTPDEGAVRDQEEVCRKYGVAHTRNQGPFGLPGNLNWVADQVKTPWFYVVEDGVRPSWGWLESLLSFLRKIENRTFEGMPVGMVGVDHIEDYALAIGGAIPQSKPDTFAPVVGQQRTREARELFYEDWNDGFWCWPRLIPKLRTTDEATVGEHAADAKVLIQAIKRIPERHSDACYWPNHRISAVAFSPGGIIAVDAKVWREVGRFRKDCTFYEGHLAIRMGMAGFLSLGLHAPLWLHSPSQGFSDPLTHEQARARGVNNRHTHDVFKEDFGFKTIDGWRTSIIPRQPFIQSALAPYEADPLPEWDVWKTKT